ncbi:hypothetical protein ACFYWX_26155 [Streptomyces sp. NPDC002888]|uniref:hypothetical protein n=1 Tax=Streptomyces sp. NPDC002888 TaxID=3364668 RepID=UPI0036C77514
MTGLLLDQADPFLDFLGKADALAVRPVRMAVHTTAPERTFGLEVGNAISLTDEPDRPDAVLTAPAEWWLRLTTGRHAPAHTPSAVSLASASLTLDDLRGAPHDPARRGPPHVLSLEAAPCRRRHLGTVRRSARSGHAALKRYRPARAR